MKNAATLKRKLRRIRLLLLDVDGVLTDGGIFYSAQGAEMKRFHVHDGYGAVRAREHGLLLGIISGRQSGIVETRAREMQITDVFLNAQDKVAAMEIVRAKYELALEELAFIGDDLFDIPLLKKVGVSAAPRNAMAGVKKVVDYVTAVDGGQGAARELIDMIIASQSRK
jgi:3-deoxy-D-manno-octulosonate 8-phosphate phosphatase (KDO 8-P phosphatase)